DLSPAVCASVAEQLLQAGEERPATAECQEDEAEATPKADGLNTRRLIEVQERAVAWIWDQRIANGKLTLLNGDPDLGKTWLMLDIMARITTGRAFPDGAPNPYGGERRDVLWVSAEDEDEDTIKPRFRMLQDDPSRFHSLQFVYAKTKAGKKEECFLNLSEHQ